MTYFPFVKNMFHSFGIYLETEWEHFKESQYQKYFISVELLVELVWISNFFEGNIVSHFLCIPFYTSAMPSSRWIHDQLDLEPSALHRSLQDMCKAGWALFFKFGNFGILGFNPNDLKLPCWQALVLNQIKKYSTWTPFALLLAQNKKRLIKKK